jgi:hypothetical protein
MRYFFLLLTSLFFKQSISQIIISQYIETESGSIPKGIEIFNSSTTDITFSASNKLEIYQGTNGANCLIISAATVSSGTLQSGKVWVIGTSDLVNYSNTNGTNLAGTTLYNFTFNGDDAIQIYLGGVLKDVFGTCGIDPGASWLANGVNTANQNIQLKSGVCSATTSNWSDPSTRFEIVSTTPSTDFTGFGNSPGCTLPVSLLFISSYKIGKNTEIKWSTGTEENNSGFEIQRSTDGINFDKIGFVKSLSSSGNSSTRLDYSFTDYNPVGLKQYYRLKQIDFDGAYKYSAIVLVTREAPTSFELTRVYPNPTQESVYINAAAHKNMELQLFIYDFGGRVVGKKQVVAQIGNNGFDMPVAHLAPGTYFIKVVNSAQEVVATQKFIKH